MFWFHLRIFKSVYTRTNIYIVRIYTFYIFVLPWFICIHITTKEMYSLFPLCAAPPNKNISVKGRVCRQIFAIYFFQSSPPLGVWYLVLMLHAEDNAPHNQTLYCIVWTILSLTRGVGTPAPLSLTPGVGGVGRTLRSQQNQSTFRRVQKALRTLVILEETIRKNQFKAEHHRWRLREEN